MVEQDAEAKSDGELEWVATLDSLADQTDKQNLRDKMRQKVKENPLVPIGIIATTLALTFGLIAMRKGDRRQSQLMMRVRVGAQGFTVAAILAGVIISGSKKKTDKT